jgi:hypothetical protein
MPEERQPSQGFSNGEDRAYRHSFVIINAFFMRWIVIMGALKTDVERIA